TRHEQLHVLLQELPNAILSVTATPHVLHC
ncbi:MAG: hypothetical protein ACJAVW_000529, partial [Spirosomataceae bacterium]